MPRGASASGLRTIHAASSFTQKTIGIWARSETTNIRGPNSPGFRVRFVVRGLDADARPEQKNTANPFLPRPLHARLAPAVFFNPEGGCSARLCSDGLHSTGRGQPTERLATSTLQPRSRRRGRCKLPWKLCALQPAQRAKASRAATPCAAGRSVEYSVQQDTPLENSCHGAQPLVLATKTQWQRRLAAVCPVWR